MKHPIDELIEWVAASALFLLCFLAALAVTGCTTHEVKVSAPQLDTVGEAMKKIVIADCQKPVLNMPPIPQECVLDIRGDVLTASSQECENLIRFYVRARSLLKPAAPGTTQP